MKKMFCILLFSIIGYSYGQNMLVEYETMNAGDVSGCELFITDSSSIFTVTKGAANSTSDNDFFMKKYTTDLAYFNERFFNIDFFVTDSLNRMQWELVNDTMSILGENCHAAKTNFRGRTYLAYYSTRYSVSEGPWKFGGLPGLILRVAADDHYIEWKATKIIMNSSKKIAVPNISKYKFIGWDDYVIKFTNTVNKWAKLSRSNGTVTNDSDTRVKIEATEIIYPALQTGEGLKL